ncbi:DNA topoisomerase [Massilia jejuensis]|uniref:DNA topoisomerase n=1 Tax=Massilia jejuensis TaxID=648894 RepID=A0ABW0PEI1_9BURK
MSRTVILAEKAAVAKEIASFLAQQQGGRSRRDDCGYRLPNGDFVGYTNGHLIDMAPIDEYMAPEQKWADPLVYLPVMPLVHKRAPRPRRNEDGSVMVRDGAPVPDPLFVAIQRKVREADIIINAGDKGREGQLVMDELFRELGIDPAAPHVMRAAVTDMHPKALEKAFAELTPNGLPRWQLSGEAARARQEGDWLVGFNGSRAYQSLLDDKSVAVGRLKGPILWMAAKREREIAEFVPVHYYTPIITLDDGTELRWKARPGAEQTEGFDAQGRITSEELARSIVDKINGGLEGRYNKAAVRRKRKAPPMPFTKTTLEMEASQRLGIPMEDVTEAMHNLYLKHRLISYIGTDCPYIPETMLLEARGIMAGLSPMFGKVMRGANAGARPDSVDDAKIGENEHHAIVPLGTLPASGRDLNAAEREVFEMITHRFAAQFYPDFEYDVTTVEVAFGNDLFVADSTQVVRYGWTEADPQEPEMDVEDEIVDQLPAEVEIDDDRDAEAA